jgi:dCTP deaminase
MILSNGSLHEALDAGRLVIEPEPQPRHKVGSAACPYQTSSVDLRLGNEIAYFKEDVWSRHIDSQKGGLPELFGPNSKTDKITKNQPFALRPGMLVIGRTLEKVTLSLPLSKDKLPYLAARVERKSLCFGLLVSSTAPILHAGFSGTIILELINLGAFDILLYPNVPICQLIVEEVRGIPFRTLVF